MQEHLLRLLMYLIRDLGDEIYDQIYIEKLNKVFSSINKADN